MVQPELLLETKHPSLERPEEDCPKTSPVQHVRALRQSTEKNDRRRLEAVIAAKGASTKGSKYLVNEIFNFFICNKLAKMSKILIFTHDGVLSIFCIRVFYHKAVT